MTPEFLRTGAPAAVLRALPGARAVGGAVRDFLAGKPIHDVDVAVARPPEEAARLLRAAGLKVFETGLKHGTVTAVLDGVPVEVTSLRRDVVTDGRHAEVEWTDDWAEDAARRDFTINAMSMGVDGALHDYFGGRDDLEAGRVRFVGVAAERLAEDYLRALRFFRFWARYGRGEPDCAAVAAIRDAVPGLARLSVERVWMELKRLLAAEDPREALQLMAGTGVLAAVLPSFDLMQFTRLLEAGAPADPLLRFGALIPDDVLAASVARPLKMSGEEERRLGDMRHSQAAMSPCIDDVALVARLADQGVAIATDRSWYAEARDGISRSALRSRIALARVPPFPVTGKDALAEGFEPGPQLGAALGQARQWWYENGTRASKQEVLRKLRELANLPPA